MTQYIYENVNLNSSNFTTTGNITATNFIGALPHSNTTGQTIDDHHNQFHTIVSHSDTTATGAELNTLTDDSMADTLHRHSELSASDGSPDAILKVSATGAVSINRPTPFGANLEVGGVTIFIDSGGQQMVIANDEINFLSISVGSDGETVFISEGTDPDFMIKTQDGTGLFIDDSANNNKFVGGLEINSNVQAGRTFILHGGGVSGGVRSLQMEWRSGQGDTLRGFNYVNINSQFVWDATAQSSNPDTGNAWVDFTDGSASFGSHNFTVDGSGNLTKVANITITEAKDIILGTTTGTKIGTATTQKLSFYGVTPIVQQTTISQTPATFTANSSGIVDDTATWNGYTIGDLVAILQAYGWLA